MIGGFAMRNCSNVGSLESFKLIDDIGVLPQECNHRAGTEAGEHLAARLAYPDGICNHGQERRS